MLAEQGFAVIDGELGFMNVADGAADLTGVLYHATGVRRLRVVIIDAGREIDGRRIAQAAGLTPARATGGKRAA